jgi:hypothetical protein
MLFDRRRVLEAVTLSPLMTPAFAVEKANYSIRIAKGLV